MFYNFFFKNHAVCDKVKKHSRAGQATHDNTIRRMCIACLTPKATNRHS